MLTIERVDNCEEKVKRAKLALRNRLYVNKWRLKYTLQSVRDRPEDYRIAACFHNNDIVGIMVACNLDGQVATYVKPKYRRKKIATRMVDILVQDKSDFYAFPGIKGSEKFWHQANIVIVDY
jgi:ribosomal protein S18 acetylase RimI-like enzyme